MKDKLKISLSLVKYVVVGVSAFLVEYISFLVLFRQLGLSIVGANILSFVFGLMSSFILNRLWTFNDASHRHKTTKQFGMYTLLAVINLALTIAIVQVLVNLDIRADISKLLAMVVTSLWNFILFKLVIFRYQD